MLSHITWKRSKTKRHNKIKNSGEENRNQRKIPIRSQTLWVRNRSPNILIPSISAASTVNINYVDVFALFVRYHCHPKVPTNTKVNQRDQGIHGHQLLL